PYQGYLSENCTTIAEVMRGAGYHTLMTGKWHLGADRKECWPLQRGFDFYFGGISGAFNYFQPGGNRGITRGNEPVTTDSSFYSTDTFTDEACQYLSLIAQQDDRPFFLYLAYNAPHWPLNAKWEDYQKYRGRYKSGWDALMKQRLAKQVELGIFSSDVAPAPHTGRYWNDLSAEQQDDMDSIMAAYAGCIDSIDQNIGKLVAHLKSLERFDNTLIFFLSDNGACQEGGMLGKGNEAMVKDPPLGTTDGVRLGEAWAIACNTPLRKYKHFLHEGGARTPLIAHWPQGIADSLDGGFIDQHAYLPDFMATCLAVSGATYPENLPACEGQSLLPALAGSNEPVHSEPIYFEHEGNAAMMWQKWKLVREYQKPWELYKLENDPAELVNLAKDHAEQTSKMVKMWETWAKERQVAYPSRFNMYEHIAK
ncbi:MAG: sulfatase-like hydrolase/transferase, partial [Planctomycetales bacterium]|nr:sulfatase-like hydrolase/transferase [Planctomycetales bacterium]